MVKSDALSIEPFINDEGEVMIQIKFSNVERYHMKVLNKTNIYLPEFLGFIEDCMVQFEEPEKEIRKGFLSVEHLKTAVNLIGGDSFSFQIKRKEWQRFIEIQAEKLLLSGVIKI